MEITLISTTHIVDDLYRFRFSKPPAVEFDAGDYVELELKSDTFEDRRWFTISSSPAAEYLEFITKIHPHGSEFKQHLAHIAPGSAATISPPMGTFNLPRSGSKKIVWIAAGIGVTPFLSMSRWLQHTKQDFDITTIYVAKPGAFYFEDELKKVSTGFHKTSERISSDWIYQKVDTIHDRIIYLSGPEAFCTTLFDAFLARGLTRRQINLDYFPGYDSI